MSSTSNWLDQGVEATRSLDQNGHTSTACAPIEAGVSNRHDNSGLYQRRGQGGTLGYHTVTFPDLVSPRAVGAIHTARPNHRASYRNKGSVFDRPGKKMAAEYEPDPDALRTRCRQQGGNDFAVTWLSKIFVGVVTVDALLRPLTMLEVDAMRLRLPGFKPAQGYDGFLARINERFECGLCPDDRRIHWKNKKDAVPHLRKFHFGLADRCMNW